MGTDTNTLQVDIEKTSTPWLSKEVMIPRLQSMNDKQKEIFYHIRQWSLSKCHQQNTAPFRLFLTGGAGAGKSHVISCIFYEMSRIFGRFLNCADGAAVMLSASTGVAAFNINGCTLHNLLSLDIHMDSMYRPLGEEKLNSLRTKLSGLQILVIDEISMVDHRLLSHVHGRLQQVNRTADGILFGNVSVLAVGDFYQLSPVMGKSLYDDAAIDLWNGEFQLAELSGKSERQVDAEFADALNICRTRKKGETLPEWVVKMLQSRETGEDCSDALHIYGTNDEVDKYNLIAVQNNCSDLLQVAAHDFKRDKKTGSLTRQVTCKRSRRTTTLPSSLVLGSNARVQLTQNIDVSDGLVNGANGTVVHIERKSNDENDLPSKVSTQLMVVNLFTSINFLTSVSF